MATKSTVASLAQELEALRNENAELRKLLDSAIGQLDSHDELIVRHEKFVDWYKANRLNSNASKPQAAQPPQPAAQPQQQKPAAQPAQPPQRRGILNRFGKKNGSAPANGAPIVTTWQDYAKYMDAVKEAAIRSKKAISVKNYAEAKHIPLQDLLANITA